jgi:hypothetical protein
VSYRPAGEPLITSQYEIVQVREDARVKAFIEEHHYSSSYPAARFRFELWYCRKCLALPTLAYPVELLAYPRQNLSA